MIADLNQFKTIYFEECHELLSSAEEHLMQLLKDDYNNEDVHAVFRAIHSIKGGAGSFGFTELIEFAHLFETVLDALRDQRLSFTKDIGNTLLHANDVLADLIQRAQNNVTDDQTLQIFFIQQQLRDVIHSLQEDISSNTSIPSEAPSQNSGYSLYKIDFNPKPQLMTYGNDPKFIFKELERLTSTEKNASFNNEIDITSLPKLNEFNCNDCYLKWNLEINAPIHINQIKEAFEFVEDDCTLNIETKNQEPCVPKKEQEPLAKSTIALPPSPQKQTHEEVAHSIRVELDRIDKLVNTVGEMVIKQAMILDQAQTVHRDISDDLIKGLHELTLHMRDLQDCVMAIRAQPVKAVFNRMPRLVRELALELKKDVHIHTSGENTEIDKTVIERLGEPLTHMIRNALDHGIESPEERVKLGKPAQGTIRLSAEHKSGRIVIEIEDDGRGINRQRVLEKALENGLVTTDSNLSGEEIDALIFHPGFSTAQNVTNISGRGVGMDVVKKSIQSLGGRISTHSIEGKGCRFTLTLPLTLAVLDGMIVTTGKEVFVVPLINIIETIRPQAKQISKLVGCHDILHLRQNTIPLIYLHDLFNISNAIHDPTQSIVVVVETEGGELLGLVVDQLQNQQQVVIKSIEENYDPIPGVSAATILGNGRVALILDVTALKMLDQMQKQNHGVKEIKEMRTA